MSRLLHFLSSCVIKERAEGFFFSVLVDAFITHDFIALLRSKEL